MILTEYIVILRSRCSRKLFSIWKRRIWRDDTLLYNNNTLPWLTFLLLSYWVYSELLFIVYECEYAFVCLIVLIKKIALLKWRLSIRDFESLKWSRINIRMRYVLNSLFLTWIFALKSEKYLNFFKSPKSV